ncbi:MAG TPA: helix-hairpin-helix domain-containing protein [Polyangiaceae bacterium LLY-WYZ-15_(1-7)]|nr:helix-hairpin-helix domain-containing protein [Polyangiaceae bacterium LLY-WYZ-15_(1-7)]HJL06210.1 helix-hairpin-helix domain-containing protein [Polyangiaceae bacterium LLY-WYZ-15_(1-7)]HJL10895.1 helix-hairpin-helix domain-containing protein [Polyangiaceae bacterium LLY-WYZ-15_(1-7)]HJL21561.1 helix-hairpin-helix domain-containing protein [Polyangiaceae bacterium LLY-WYZ-15_(1-7)]
MSEPPAPARRSVASAPILVLALVVAALGAVGLARGRQAELLTVPVPKAAAPKESAGARALREGRGIDVNTASREDLELLPRIGPTLAERIEEARPFASVDELVRVRGIGPRTLERLRPMVRVGSAGEGDLAGEPSEEAPGAP